MAFNVIFSHADKFGLSGCVGGGNNKHWSGRVLNDCDTRGVIFGANCGPFYVYHPS